MVCASALVDLAERVPPLRGAPDRSLELGGDALRHIGIGIAGLDADRWVHHQPVLALVPPAVDREDRHLGHPPQPGGGGAELDLAAAEVDDHGVATIGDVAEDRREPAGGAPPG